MSTRIENAGYDLAGFIPYKNKALRDKYDALLAEIKEANQYNVSAQIKVGSIDEKEIDISDYQYCEHYEIDTYTVRNEDGEEFSTEEEYTEYLEKKAKKQVRAFVRWGFYIDEEYEECFVYSRNARDAMEQYRKDNEDDERVLEVKPYYFIVTSEDEGIEDYGSFDQIDNKDDVITLLEEAREEWIEEQYEFDDLEKEYDECYWNTVWQYEGDVNTELATRLGFGVLTFCTSRYGENPHEGESFIFLTGCGMDLSPKIVAYQALEFGYIDKQYASKLDSKSSREWFNYVVGQKVYEEVVKVLGIEFVLEMDKEEEKASA